MPITTIKVDGAVRDRLAHVAQARGLTMGALLSEVAAQLEDEQYWDEVGAAYERLQRDDPAGWAEYLDELGEWEAGTPGADTTAAADWPEYNR